MRRITTWALSAVLVSASLFAFLAPTPYLVERPGPVYNVLSNIGTKPMIKVVGKTSYPVSGALNMLTVNLKGDSTRGASWFDVGMAMIDPSQAVLKITDIYPPGATEGDLNQEAEVMMLDSQANAKAAALKLLNIPYTTSVKVTAVTKTGAAANILKAADTLLFIQGQVAVDIDQVRALVAATQGKSAVQLVVERDGKRLELSVMPKFVDKAWRMGIFVQSVPKFPFKIDIEVGNVGGPSAGQILTLAVYDKLTPGELTGGEDIAGTGTITPAGEVGAIGGIRQKLYGAVRAGAKWFLAPSENCDEVIGHIPDGIRVFKVSTIQDSLKAVKAIASKTGIDQLPTCTK